MFANTLIMLARRRAAATGIVAVFAATALSAETVATINGVDLDSSVVNFYLESRLQKPAAQATPDEREAVIAELSDLYLLSTQPIAKTLANDAAIKAQIELSRRGALAQAVASHFLENNTASDEEIAAMYAQQTELAPPLQFKARHILVETQAAANDMINQLNGGADFAQLATENSTGPSGPSGGDLGWFSPEQMVPAFSNAVAALEDGSYTREPVQSQFGWHVILREESRANEPPPLDSVRDVVKQQVEQTKFQNYIEGLRSVEEAAE